MIAGDDLWMPSFLQWWGPVIGSVVALFLMLISLVLSIIGNAGRRE